jgi:hypothetical protein
MGNEVVVSYSSQKKVLTPKELAREVKRALETNEEVAGFEYEDIEKRKVLREELAHHIPASNRPVRVVGLLKKDGEGEYTASTVGIKHYGATPREELESALAPKSDKRFDQVLSEEDKKIAKKNKRRLFGR